MALITLLLQPEEDLPSLIVLDEPELGLHPYAISLIAALVRSASVYTQVILATQSTNLLDHFEPEDVIIVEQQQGMSLFKRLASEKLTAWLEDYTLSELWEKNVIGGESIHMIRLHIVVEGETEFEAKVFL
jgi:predicted ATPase